jgi:hypothetical protein
MENLTPRKKVLPEDKRNLLLEFIEIQQVFYCDIAAAIGIHRGSLASALKGERMLSSVVDKVESFMDKIGVNASNLQDIDLEKWGFKITSPQKLDDETIKKINSFRRSKNVSLDTIGKGIGMHGSTMSEALNGKTLNYNTFRKISDFAEMIPSLSAEPHLKVIDAKSQDNEDECLKEKLERLVHLLLALEIDLRFFKKAGEKEREAFRKNLDPDDIGFITSSLSMLCGDEERFARSKERSTNKFGFFKGGKR